MKVLSQVELHPIRQTRSGKNVHIIFENVRQLEWKLILNLFSLKRLFQKLKQDLHSNFSRP